MDVESRLICDHPDTHEYRAGIGKLVHGDGKSTPCCGCIFSLIVLSIMSRSISCFHHCRLDVVNVRCEAL